MQFAVGCFVRVQRALVISREDVRLRASCRSNGVAREDPPQQPAHCLVFFPRSHERFPSPYLECAKRQILQVPVTFPITGPFPRAPKAPGAAPSEAEASGQTATPLARTRSRAAIAPRSVSALRRALAPRNRAGRSACARVCAKPWLRVRRAACRFARA